MHPLNLRLGSREIDPEFQHLNTLKSQFKSTNRSQEKIRRVWRQAASPTTFGSKTSLSPLTACNWVCTEISTLSMIRAPRRISPQSRECQARMITNPKPKSTMEISSPQTRAIKSWTWECTKLWKLLLTPLERRDKMRQMRSWARPKFTTIQMSIRKMSHLNSTRTQGGLTRWMQTECWQLALASVLKKELKISKSSIEARPIIPRLITGLLSQTWTHRPRT